MEELLQFGHVQLSMSDLDKVIFPDAGITKGDLLAYYCDLAAVMLPYTWERPLVGHCFPKGIDGPCFEEREASGELPDWIDRATIETEGGTEQYLLCNKKATLAYLVEHDCITPYCWLCSAENPHHPDRLMFDLELAYDSAPFSLVSEGAHCLRSILRELQLNAYVETSGLYGLHVVAPIRPILDVERAYEIAHRIAELAVEKKPGTLTCCSWKDWNDAPVHIDFSSNSYAGKSVTPYSVLPQPGAPVATPLCWDELENENLHAQRFTLDTIGPVLTRRPDPWLGIDLKKGDPARARTALAS